MPVPTQTFSILPLGMGESSKGFPVASLQKAFSLEPGLVSKAADKVTFGVSGLSHVTKGVDSLSGPSTHSDAEIKAVSKNFESIFMQMLFKEMRDSVQKSDLFGNSQGMEFFQGMYDDQMSQQLASAGGLGIGRLVYDRLKATTESHQKTFQ
jgi:flagellar protein FlgJ